jgi:hypothetical protein
LKPRPLAPFIKKENFDIAQFLFSEIYFVSPKLAW